MRISTPLRRSRRLISLTPLIDVVFILLLFFMLASNLTQWRAIKVTTASAGQDQTPLQQPLQIRLENNGAVYLNNTPMALNTLLGHVSEALLEQPERALVVQPGKAVSLQAIIDLLDALRAAGGQQLSLQRGEH